MSKWRALAAGVVAVVFVCALIVGLAGRERGSSRGRPLPQEKGLYSKDEDTRERAAEKLKLKGVSGRMALLRAVRSKNDLAGDTAYVHICSALAKDIEAGRDMGPGVRAGVKGINDPGNAGIRCARIASEGWALGLLDEESKQAVGRRAFEIEIKARPEYLVGKGAPLLSISTHEMASVLAFQYECRIFLDGQDTGESSSHRIAGGLREWWNPVLDTPKVGQYALHAKVKVELKKVDTEGQINPAEEAVWKIEFDTDPVVFRVVEDLPDDHLQATTTPKLEQLVQKAVKLEGVGRDESAQLSDTVEVVGTDCAVLVYVDPPLPFDLAFRPRWSAGGKDLADPWRDMEHVILKGEHQALIANFPDNLDSRKLGIFATPGEHVLTCKLILEPSLEAALNNPDVEAYWPQPIELAEFTIRVKVKKKETTSDEQR